MRPRSGGAFFMGGDMTGYWIGHGNDALEPKIKTMWLDNMPMSEIGKELGITRNRVAGMISRMRKRNELPARTAEQVQAVIDKTAALRLETTKARRAARALQEEEKAAPAAPTPPQSTLPASILDAIRNWRPPKGVSIQQLDASHCRTVLEKRDEDGLRMYCGEPVFHRAYCAPCAARYFRLPEKVTPEQARQYRKLRLLLAVSA